MADDPLDRLRAIAAIASSAAARIETWHAFSEGDALALRACVEEIERQREVLRSLACYLSVGGYNSETVNPEEFERKIRDGIGMLTKPLESMVEKLRAEKEDLRQRNQLLRTRLDEFSPERIKPRLDILRRLDELQAENASKDDLIRQLSERVAICSELLGKRAEKGA